MKKPQVSTCDRQIFKALNREIYDFAQEIRVAIRAAVDASVAVVIEQEDASIVRMWGTTLGPLMHDISGSALLLLVHGDRRAPVILTRSLFEYQVRQRYYALRPDKARAALGQLGERFKKIMRADFTWSTALSDEERAEIEAWLAKKQKLEHENIKVDVFETVYGEDAPAYYDGLYGTWSSLVHGYETVFRDVHRDGIGGERNPKPDLKGKVWSRSDTCSVIVDCLLPVVRVVVSFGVCAMACPELFRVGQDVHSDGDGCGVEFATICDSEEALNDAFEEDVSRCHRVAIGTGAKSVKISYRTEPGPMKPNFHYVRLAIGNRSGWTNKISQCRR